jgi:hypothetical protein
MTQSYQLTNTTDILRTADQATIPADPKNCDYIAYQNWLTAGNTPDPAPIPDPLPTFIAEVQEALDNSDKTMARIQEAITLNLNSATAPDVVAFVNYRRSLRELLRSTTVQALPAVPPFPAGT